MAFVITFAKGIRNHWKKSTFAAVAITYGTNYAKEYYDTQQLMREYCQKAAVYGREPIAADENPRIITVILNPNANKRKATANFEKYCAPILNLAGICVDVVQTESEGHAKTLMDSLPPTDAIVVAGGDGTLSEVITGLLRKSKGDRTNIPIGVLPLGKSNSIGKSLFPGGDYLETAHSLADACLAVIEKCTRPIDVMKIEVIDDEEMKGKAVYAVASIEWGAYRDAEKKRDKYWYFGPLRKYATYLFNGYKSSLSWNCQASIKYTLPCEGCLNCVNPIDDENSSKKRWYHRFFPRKQQLTNIPTVAHEECKEVHEKEISTLDLCLTTTNTLLNFNKLPTMNLKLGPDSVNYLTFVNQGWQSENGKPRLTREIVEAKQIELTPATISNEQNERWFSIDKEEFEVKPVRITLLPQAVKMFCRQGELNISL